LAVGGFVNLNNIDGRKITKKTQKKYQCQCTLCHTANSAPPPEWMATTLLHVISYIIKMALDDVWSMVKVSRFRK